MALGTWTSLLDWAKEVMGMEKYNHHYNKEYAKYHFLGNERAHEKAVDKVIHVAKSWHGAKCAELGL